MDFNTLLFPCFFAAAALGYYLLPYRLRPYWLLLASYAFYCWKPENRSLALLLAGTSLLTWLAGLLLGLLHRPWVRRGLLALSVLACLGPLFVYKYFDFFARSLADAAGISAPPALDLIAPLGLSYFTFQSLGYVIDCYRRKYAPWKNPLHYALFVSFFPCIFTGPIERADHLQPQLLGRLPFDYNNLAGGAFRMLWGYCKKMVLAEHLAVFVQAYYSGSGTVAATGPAQAAAAVLFSLQLYFDFSGSCDIAIGGARLFGIRLLENFDNPFLATSFSELWRRWHKSLNSWFRDYLYFSLGGSRCALWRWGLNLMLVFLLSGLWHGAAAGYLWWGLLCGILVLLERLPQRLRAAARPKAYAAAAGPAEAAPVHTPALPGALRAVFLFMAAWSRRILVFCEFSFCFILFAASLYGGGSPVLLPYQTLLTGWSMPNILQLGASLEACGFTAPLAAVVAGGSALVLLIESRGDVADWIRRRLFCWRWPLYYLLVFALLFFGVFGQSAFIYQLY